MAVVIRRYIAKDNNCLFSAAGYLCEGRQGAICTELRAAVAEHVRNSPDVSEVMLGMDKEEYCKWIKNEMNWGGENEVCFLCDKFNVEIQVVMMGASSSSLTYGQGAGRRGRVYLLYTGQHYDAMVGGEHPDVLPDSETKVFPLGTACDAFDAQVCASPACSYVTHWVLRLRAQALPCASLSLSLSRYLSLSPPFSL